MFNTVLEKVVVAVLVAVSLTALGFTWSKVSSLATGISLPRGAIVAYETACPIGWQRYTAGTSRVLVGAGDEFDAGLAEWVLAANGSKSPLPVYSVRQSGGEVSHLLTVSEIPSHTHGQVWGQGAGDRAIPAAGNSLGMYHGQVMTQTTTATGGSQMHNNMPPFIAVNLCVKQ